jgi:predicted GNAT superfamily acetyltransferase
MVKGRTAGCDALRSGDIMARELRLTKSCDASYHRRAGGGETECGAMNQVDERAMLALNNEHREETSELNAAELHANIVQGFHVGLRDDGRDAFLIAFDQDAISASPNFQWFKSRYKRFIYIDRVIVAPHKRGRGLARALYADLFAAAVQAGQSLVGCEVNVEPPNPISDAFHEALGFVEVGRAALFGGDKVVRYLVKTV